MAVGIDPDCDDGDGLSSAGDGLSSAPRISGIPIEIRTSQELSGPPFPSRRPPMARAYLAGTPSYIFAKNLTEKESSPSRTRTNSSSSTTNGESLLGWNGDSMLASERVTVVRQREEGAAVSAAARNSVENFTKNSAAKNSAAKNFVNNFVKNSGKNSAPSDIVLAPARVPLECQCEESAAAAAAAETGLSVPIAASDASAAEKEQQRGIRSAHVRGPSADMEEEQGYRGAALGAERGLSADMEEERGYRGAALGAERGIRSALVLGLSADKEEEQGYRGAALGADRGIRSAHLVRGQSARPIAGAGAHSLEEKKASCSASDLLLAGARNGGLAAQAKVLVRQGAKFWFDVFVDWLKKLLRFPKEEEVCMPMPEWSWLSIMGSPIIQSLDAQGEQDGSCVICACLKCIIANHTLDFERRYGSGSFPYQLSDIEEFKFACEVWMIWSPGKGTDEELVLGLVQKLEGLRTLRVPGWKNCKLQIDGHERFITKLLDPLSAAMFIHKGGPVVGSLEATNDYFKSNWDESYVFEGSMSAKSKSSRRRRRNKKTNNMHSVVCFAYRFTSSGLHIRIMDNHFPHGPLRWISYSAFEEFWVIQISPLDADLLRETDDSTRRSFMRKLTPF